MTDRAQVQCFCFIKSVTEQAAGAVSADGAASGNVYGTYVHGIFDAPGIARKITGILAADKGLTALPPTGQDPVPETNKDLAALPPTGQDPLLETSKVQTDLPPENQDPFPAEDSACYKEAQYNLLAETLREHLDMEKIREIMGL